ncbi:hypothetical protein M0638_07130 [Roseomonas sp. NAR14]|uniref:Uncharacterized protein n=1 Tax=Roseomonas acroporae TaxID=2937791 RepID=A0A9X1Y6S6_9PROT|nr:hypothetical protein [Roseomonas acroporae]MCK8784148.1 hypothetical protein [Roseomonas acroporae]
MTEADRYNERLKLAATFLNTVGSGSIVVGAVAPVVGLITGAAGAHVRPAVLVTMACLMVVIGLILHRLASLTLKRLV